MICTQHDPSACLRPHVPFPCTPTPPAWAAARAAARVRSLAGLQRPTTPQLVCASMSTCDAVGGAMRGRWWAATPGWLGCSASASCAAAALRGRQRRRRRFIWAGCLSAAHRPAPLLIFCTLSQRRIGPSPAELEPRTGPRSPNRPQGVGLLRQPTNALLPLPASVPVVRAVRAWLEHAQRCHPRHHAAPCAPPLRGLRPAAGCRRR